MKRKPIIAVVGRPNVGKSTFVNRLVGKRQSIVDDLPGVTRDRIYFDVEWQNKQFTVIDTGGIVPGDEDEIMLSIYDQAKIACEEAEKIIFIVDGIEGVTPVDSDIANILRQSGKPIFLAVNKVDSYNQITMLCDFYSLAIGEPIAISALHGSGGVGDLLEEITSDFEIDEDIRDDETIKIAIVGRPNAGKSSIVNALLGEKRVIVSDISGTTRDGLAVSSTSLQCLENLTTKDFAHLGQNNIRFINDSNATALAGILEYPDAKVLIGITNGTGIGCGVVINGQLFTGANGLAGEIYGNPTVGPDGDIIKNGKIINPQIFVNHPIR